MPNVGPIQQVCTGNWVDFGAYRPITNHFAGWHILLFVGYHQFPPQHCHSCHSYWGHFLSLLHFVTRTRLDFLDFRANSHSKVFKKNTICPIEGMFSQHVQPGMRQTLLEKGRLLQWLGAPQFASLALSQLKRLGREKWEVTSSQGQSGVGNCPILGILDITW